MKRNYDECVTKYSDSFVRVVLDPGYVSRIQNFVTELVEAKSKEDHHKIESSIPSSDRLNQICIRYMRSMTEFFSNIELGVDGRNGSLLPHDRSGSR